MIPSLRHHTPQQQSKRKKEPGQASSHKPQATTTDADPVAAVDADAHHAETREQEKTKKYEMKGAEEGWVHNSR